MSKIVQRSIQIQEEISALKSIDRRLLSTDSRAKYQYSERALKLLKAAEQHSSNQKYAGHPVKAKSGEVVSISSGSESESIELVEEIN